MKRLLALIMGLLILSSSFAFAEGDSMYESSETITTPTVESEMLDLVNSFNASSEVQLVFAEDFTPSDESSSHYRTEFRLGAYSDAIGKSYIYNETFVDLVGRKTWSGNIIIRVYMDNATLDQCVEMVKYVSPILDFDIDPTELQEAIDYIKEYKSANGYYYADLGLLLLGNDIKGYAMTQELLFEGKPFKYNPETTYKVLKRGDQGEDVKRLQEALIKLGYLNGAADGVFGAQTEQAVIYFNIQNFYITEKTASERMQRILFEGNPERSEKHY